MNKIALYILTPILLFGCDNSKWETIKGNGINDDPKSIDNVIYFENIYNGLVGGYTLIEDRKTKTADSLVLIPTLFLTEDGGKNWNEVNFNPTLRNSNDNVYRHGDTLICQLDTLLLKVQLRQEITSRQLIIPTQKLMKQVNKIMLAVTKSIRKMN